MDIWMDTMREKKKGQIYGLDSQGWHSTQGSPTMAQPVRVLKK